MLSFASALMVLAGIGILAFKPLPRQRSQRLKQQALGALLFAAGLVGVIAVVVMKGQLIG